MTDHQPGHKTLVQLRADADQERAALEARAPHARTVLVNQLRMTPGCHPEFEAFLHQIADHVESLAWTDLRFRLLTSFVDLDLAAAIEDYFDIHVGCDTFALTAISRLLENPTERYQQNLDRALDLILLDVVAFEMALPEMRTMRGEKQE
jgi:hypothetical protein